MSGDGQDRGADAEGEPPGERAPPWALGAAAALVVSGAFPFEVDRERPVFLWEALRDLPAPAAAAALAPALAGAVVGAAATSRRELLAPIAAAAAAAALLLGWIAREAPAWDLLALPSSWTGGSALPVLGLGLVAASARAAKGASRGLFAAGASLVALFYAVPVLGEPPAAAIARLLAGTQPGRRALPAALLAAFLLWPAVILLGFARPRRTPRAPAPLPVLALTLPVVMLPLVYRSITGLGTGAFWILRLAGAAVVLGALVTLLAGALPALLAPGGSRLAKIAFAAVAVVLLAAVQLTAVRPAPPTGPWLAGPGTEALDRLFGDLLPAWNDAQAAGSDGGREEAARAVAAAEEVDPALGRALAALAHETSDPALTERRFYRLVGALDEASRAAGLPYYVDPTEIVVRGDRPWFRLDAYHVREARTLRFDGRTVVALRLSAVSPARTSRGLLGLSRDGQALALVSLDAIDDYRRLVQRLARETPPRCRDANRSAEEVADPERRCGELLRALVAAPDLGATLVSMVERHEAQHQIDGPRLRRPRLVRERLDAYDPLTAARVNRELSAYLAQMTSPGAAPRLTLARLAQLAHGARGVERLAAGLTLEALAGAQVEAEEALGALGPLGDEGLRQRAAETWRHLYGERLPEHREAHQ
jgi:hypothetical protein